MSGALQEEKARIRKRILAQREALSEEDAKAKSHVICKRLIDLPVTENADRFFIYVSFNKEVRTHSLIKTLVKRHKTVAVPAVDPRKKSMQPQVICDFDTDLKPGHWGILEPDPARCMPLDSSSIDVVVVPGVAFSESGDRIGFGGGYYDRFLYDLKAPALALAYEFQVFQTIPRDRSFDEPVRYIITEARIIDCRNKSISG